MRHLSNRALTPVCIAAIGLSAAAVAGCASQRIAIAESFGYAKREQLVDRVEEARDSQQEAKKQFESALAEFIAVTGVKTGELEARYENLKKEYERSEDKAETVTERIDSVERVADALFKEWQAELKEYSSESLRKSSQQQLDDTKRQYQALLSAMKEAESKMAPVLAAFKDQVLFLKHNLNARAIASLKETVQQIEGDVGVLIKEMEESIAKADAFIKDMQSAE
jgi:hypothetical protein